MFPCEDSKTLSVCPYPEKRNHHSFLNISPTLVIDTSMERSSLQHGTQRIIFKKSCFWHCILTCAQLFLVLLASFFSFYGTLMGLLSRAVHKHSCWSQHAFVHLCFDKTTSRMHSRLFKGRHLVFFIGFFIIICAIEVCCRVCLHCPLYLNRNKISAELTTNLFLWFC